MVRRVASPRRVSSPQDLFSPVHVHRRVAVEGDTPLQAVIADEGLLHFERGDGGVESGEFTQRPVQYRGQLGFQIVQALSYGYHRLLAQLLPDAGTGDE